jgi:hypothetical protein
MNSNKRWTDEGGEIVGALARGYCSNENQHKVLDPVLIQAMAVEIQNLLDQQSAHLVERIKTVALELSYREDCSSECEDEHPHPVIVSLEPFFRAIDIIKDNK